MSVATLGRGQPTRLAPHDAKWFHQRMNISQLHTMAIATMQGIQQSLRIDDVATSASRFQSVLDLATDKESGRRFGVDLGLAYIDIEELVKDARDPLQRKEALRPGRWVDRAMSACLSGISHLS